MGLYSHLPVPTVFVYHYIAITFILMSEGAIFYQIELTLKAQVWDARAVK